MGGLLVPEARGAGVSDVALDHFTRRAAFYDRSSRWCTDPALGAAIVAAVDATPASRLLDVACGTGLVSRLFHGHVAEVVGLDFTPAMYEQAAPHLDRLVVGSAESMPFADGEFDRVVERQGVQFMDDRRAVAEMVRVTRPGGRVVLVQLCAYGEADRAEYFEVLRLRNPARRNFYVRDDLRRLLLDAGCRAVEVREHVSEEDVDAWADNRAIGDAPREAIRAIYREGSRDFLALHGVRQEGGHFVDRMLFGIAVGVR